MERDSREALTPTVLKRSVEISLPYASQLLSGRKPVPQPLAIRIFRATGHKLGPIAEATDAEIDVLERFQARAAGATDDTPSDLPDAANAVTPKQLAGDRP